MTRRTLVLVALVAATCAGIVWSWRGGAPEPASPPPRAAEAPADPASVRGRPVVVWPGSVDAPSEAPLALASPTPSPEPLSAQQLADVAALKGLDEPPSLEPLTPDPTEPIVIEPNERSGAVSLAPLVPAAAEPIVIEPNERSGPVSLKPLVPAPSEPIVVETRAY